MKRKSDSIILITLLLFLLLLSACSKSIESANDQALQIKLPKIRGTKTITLSPSDLERMKLNYLGYELTLFSNSLEVLQTDKSPADFLSTLEDDLIKQGWRMETVNKREIWKNGDQVVIYIYEENLNTKLLDHLRKAYGITKLKEGQTMILVYQFDQSQVLPNLTETAQSISCSATQTQDAIDKTQAAQSYEATRTQQIMEQEVQQTQQALDTAATKTQQAMDAAATATQQAIQAEQEEQNAIATAQALQPIFEEMGTDFESEDSLPDGMTIVREDPTRWDLTSNPGWLHIKARYSSFRDENWIAKNIFLMPLRYTNVSIITRVDASMDYRGQSVYMSLIPNDYRSNGYTVQLGLSMGDRQGRTVYAWACDTYDCYAILKGEFEDQIKFNGPVYLRMDVEGTKYTFYYGETDTNWTYLGEVSGFSAGDKLILGASGGHRNHEFDAYFDLLRFEAIMPD